MCAGTVRQLQLRQKSRVQSKNEPELESTVPWQTWKSQRLLDRQRKRCVPELLHEGWGKFEKYEDVAGNERRHNVASKFYNSHLNC